MTADTRTDSPDDRILGVECAALDVAQAALADPYAPTAMEAPAGELECCFCNRVYGDWVCDEEVWKLVMGAWDAGTVCPRCFTMKAYREHGLDEWKTLVFRGDWPTATTTHTPATPNDRKIQSFDHSGGSACASSDAERPTPELICPFCHCMNCQCKAFDSSGRGSSVSQLVEKLREQEKLLWVAEDGEWSDVRDLYSEAAEALTAAEQRAEEYRSYALDFKAGLAAADDREYEQARVCTCGWPVNGCTSEPDCERPCFPIETVRDFLRAYDRSDLARLIDLDIQTISELEDSVLDLRQRLAAADDRARRLERELAESGEHDRAELWREKANVFAEALRFYAALGPHDIPYRETINDPPDIGHTARSVLEGTAPDDEQTSDTTADAVVSSAGKATDRCPSTHPRDSHMQCTRAVGHEDLHHLGGITWSDDDIPMRRVSAGLTRGCHMDVSMPDRRAGESTAPYILFDVDGCLVDYKGNPLPEITRLLDTVRLLGFNIRIWSAGGKEWAREVADKIGATEALCYGKPDYPPTVEDSLALLGAAPSLQVDDDPTERVNGWPFMLVTPPGAVLLAPAQTTAEAVVPEELSPAPSVPVSSNDPGFSTTVDERDGARPSGGNS